MFIEGIEIGKLWEGGFNDYAFQCRGAHQTEWSTVVMYFEDFEAWRLGETTLERMHELDLLDQRTYYKLKAMQETKD